MPLDGHDWPREIGAMFFPVNRFEKLGVWFRWSNKKTYESQHRETDLGIDSLYCPDPISLAHSRAYFSHFSFLPTSLLEVSTNLRI